MGSQNGSNSVNGASGSYVDTLGLGRYMPEPRSRGTNVFRAVLSGANAVLSGISGGSGFSSGALDQNASYQDIINKQIEMQQQMQLVSMESNIEKSRHETAMAPIRNVRVG